MNIILHGAPQFVDTGLKLYLPKCLKTKHQIQKIKYKNSALHPNRLFRVSGASSGKLLNKHNNIINVTIDLRI